LGKVEMSTSPERYGNCVFEVIVIRQELPILIKTLNKRGFILENIDTSEIAIFCVFPFSIMASPFYFGNESEEITKGLLDSTADYVIRFSQSPISKTDAKQLVAERLIEYTDATFEKDKESFQVSERGLTVLGQIAFQHMTKGQHVGLATCLLITSHYGAAISVYEGGKVLKKQYELYKKIGHEKWVVSMMKLLKS
jgi:hypothetical protein